MPFILQTIYLLQGITHTQPAVALSFLCILLDVLQTMFKASELPNYVLNKYFYAGKFYYTHLDRIGGVVSHLNKLYRQELLDKLGENHSALRQEPASQAESENSDVSICKVYYDTIDDLMYKYIKFVFYFRFSYVTDNWWKFVDYGKFNGR